MTRLLSIPGFILALGLWVWGCADRLAGGSASETERAVVGMVRMPDGSPAAGARVVVLKQSHLEDTSLAPLIKSVRGRRGGGFFGFRGRREMVTDSGGRFRVDSLDPGDYFIEILDSERLQALLFSAKIRDTTGILSLEGSLQSVAAIEGRVRFPAGGRQSCYVQVFGLDRVARAGADGSYRLGGISEGHYRLRILAGSPAFDPVEIADVNPGAGDTLRLPEIALASFEAEDYAAWPYRREIGMNTAAAGAGISENLVNFPLLVRLDRANFDFTQSDRGGLDLRFSRNGRPLRYEIEQWDVDSGRAAIWVKLDTIFGDHATQSFRLHWGRSGTAGWSNGAMVFDTADGFAGVWHLAEEAAGTGISDLYKDATAFGTHGEDRILATDRGGIIGRGHLFTAGDFIQQDVPHPALVRPKSFTVSGWMRSRGQVTSSGALFKIATTYSLMVGRAGNPWVEIYSEGGWRTHQESPRLALDGQWHHLAGQFTGREIRIFLDGRLVGTQPWEKPMAEQGNREMHIGKGGNNAPFFYYSGHLDEIQVSGRVRSESWIRLSYENQKENSTFLEFR